MHSVDKYKRLKTPNSTFCSNSTFGSLAKMLWGSVYSCGGDDSILYVSFFFVREASLTPTGGGYFLGASKNVQEIWGSVILCKKLAGGRRFCATYVENILLGKCLKMVKTAI